MSISIFKARHLVSTVVVLLLVLNGALLWQDRQKSKRLVDLQFLLQVAQVENRVFKSEKVFGNTFVPHFNAVDLQDEETDIPYMGSQDLVVLFFEPNDCIACLQAMSSFKSTISSKVHVIGVARASTVTEIAPIVQQYGYEFPVYITKDSSFELTTSPYAVLIDKQKNIMYLSDINPSVSSVDYHIQSINQIAERRENAVVQ